MRSINSTCKGLLATTSRPIAHESLACPTFRSHRKVFFLFERLTSSSDHRDVFQVRQIAEMASLSPLNKLEGSSPGHAHPPLFAHDFQRHAGQRHNFPQLAALFDLELKLVWPGLKPSVL